MQNDPAQEWQRLTRLYGEMSDEELQNLAASFTDLTEFAQPILREEMRKRGLGDPAAVTQSRRFAGSQSAPSDPEESPRNDDEEEVPRAYLCECEGADQINQLREALRRAGVDSWVDSLSAALGRVQESQTARIFVPGDQLAVAREVASRPMPQDIIEESKIEVEDFVPPICPKCGAEDPLLESVEPTNTWRCENCGAQWTDSAAFDPASRGGN
ncbi:MAG TPA: hypothetical protein VGS02_12795 [Acidobacteriaceae bacterium]|nr:hypothetical protein [Acidobacteriaceae bacterium]